MAAVLGSKKIPLGPKRPFFGPIKRPVSLRLGRQVCACLDGILELHNFTAKGSRVGELRASAATPYAVQLTSAEVFKIVLK